MDINQQQTRDRVEHSHKLMRVIEYAHTAGFSVDRCDGKCTIQHPSNSNTWTIDVEYSHESSYALQDAAFSIEEYLDHLG